MKGILCGRPITFPIQLNHIKGLFEIIENLDKQLQSTESARRLRDKVTFLAIVQYGQWVFE